MVELETPTEDVLQKENPILKINFDLPVFICIKKIRKNIFISQDYYFFIRLSSPTSNKIDRIIISTLHTRHDIDQLCSYCK